jgi:hypothetical protein
VSGLTIVDPTTLSVNVALGSTAALGWRYAYVNTGTEQLTIGFLVDSPAAPAIASVSPSDGAQGQSLTVTITGQNTSFNPNSELILGAGVTVAQFTVTSPTRRRPSCDFADGADRPQRGHRHHAARVG